MSTLQVGQIVADGGTLGGIAAANISVGYVITENVRTGTTETLGLTNVGQMVTLNNTSEISLTIPNDGAVLWPLNSRIDLMQIGTGQVNVQNSGITVNSSGAKKKTKAQYSAASLWKQAANTWYLLGDINT